MRYSVVLMKQSFLEDNRLPEEKIPASQALRAMKAEALATVLPAIGGLGAGAYIGTKAAPEEMLTKDRVIQLSKEMGSPGIPVRLSPAQDTKGIFNKVLSVFNRAQEAGFSPDENFIQMSSESPRSILAHELGHAASLKTKPYWLRHIEMFLRRPEVGGILPVAGGALSTALLRKKDTETMGEGAARGALAGGLGGTIVYSPVLAEEASASLRGLAALKRLGVSSKELWRSRAKLLAAFSTYLAGSAGAGAGMGTGLGALGHFTDKRKRKLDEAKRKKKESKK